MVIQQLPQPLMLNALPHINELASLTEQDKACFKEIGQVLQKYDCLSKFGVQLLHRHFPLRDDEVLVEFCDEENRTLLAKPICRADLGTTDLIETVWQFSGNEVGPVQACKQYCPRDESGRHFGYKEHG